MLIFKEKCYKNYETIKNVTLEFCNLEFVTKDLHKKIINLLVFYFIHKKLFEFNKCLYTLYWSYSEAPKRTLDYNLQKKKQTNVKKIIITSIVINL